MCSVRKYLLSKIELKTLDPQTFFAMFADQLKFLEQLQQLIHLNNISVIYMLRFVQRINKLCAVFINILHFIFIYHYVIIRNI